MLFAGSALAQEPVSPYELLRKRSELVSQENSALGWSYIVSGSLAFGLSIPAYFLSEDVFSKAVYTAGETLGIAAVGYGTYLVLIENDYRRFERILHGAPELSEAERNHLSRLFLEQNAENARSARKIKVITFSLTAALNYVDGVTASEPELKTAHFFIAGINTLAAIGSGLLKSEEEKMVDSISSPRTHSRVEWVLGPMIGFRLTF